MRDQKSRENTRLSWVYPTLIVLLGMAISVPQALAAEPLALQNQEGQAPQARDRGGYWTPQVLQAAQMFQLPLSETPFGAAEVIPESAGWVRAGPNVSALRGQTPVAFFPTLKGWRYNAICLFAGHRNSRVCCPFVAFGWSGNHVCAVRGVVSSVHY